jgi:hypothetical protein
VSSAERHERPADKRQHRDEILAGEGRKGGMGRKGRKGRIRRRGGEAGVICDGHAGCAFDGGEPAFDVADRLLDLADGGFDARQAVVHDAVNGLNGARFV